MADDQEIIEIYEYYQDKLEKEESEPIPEPAPAAEKKTVLSSAVKTISDITDKLAKNPQDKSGVYITLAVLASVVIILLGYITGLAIPKNTERINAKIESLRETDTRYADAVRENERLSARVDKLYNEKAEITAQLNGINDYETKRDRVKQDIDDITAQLDELNAQLDGKRGEVSELDERIKAIGGKVTLKPGMYTVGEHIAAGEYHVKGDGSMLVSDSAAKLKVNTRLTQNSSYMCRLSDGDTIKLETKAELNPSE